MLLSACGPSVGSDTTNSPTVTAEPIVTDSVVTDPPVTEPPELVERFDHIICEKEGTYVMNKNGSTSYIDTNFGTNTEIHIKSNGANLTRYGCLKFDISSLNGDNDFTATKILSKEKGKYCMKKILAIIMKICMMATMLCATISAEDIVYIDASTFDLPEGNGSQTDTPTTEAPKTEAPIEDGPAADVPTDGTVLRVNAQKSDGSVVKIENGDFKDFANMMQIEFVHITKDTTVESLEERLMIADLVWKLK